MPQKTKLTITGSLGFIIEIIGITITTVQTFKGSIWVGIVIILIGVLPIIYFFQCLRPFIQTLKTFGHRWRMIDGQLMIGNSFNVALRTKTLQTIFDTFEEQCTDEKFITILQSAGKNCGQEFGLDLRKEILQRNENDSIIFSEKSNKNIKEALLLWAKYDSNTGMGKIDITGVSYLEGNFKGSISIINCFLAQERHESKRKSTCSFLEGYLTGIILELLDEHVIVKEKSCGSVAGNKTCFFEFSKRASNKIRIDSNEASI